MWRQLSHTRAGFGLLRVATMMTTPSRWSWPETLQCFASFVSLLVCLVFLFSSCSLNSQSDYIEWLVLTKGPSYIWYSCLQFHSVHYLYGQPRCTFVSGSASTSWTCTFVSAWVFLRLLGHLFAADFRGGSRSCWSLSQLGQMSVQTWQCTVVSAGTHVMICAVCEYYSTNVVVQVSLALFLFWCSCTCVIAQMLLHICHCTRTLSLVCGHFWSQGTVVSASLSVAVSVPVQVHSCLCQRKCIRQCVKAEKRLHSLLVGQLSLNASNAQFQFPHQMASVVNNMQYIYMCLIQTNAVPGAGFGACQCSAQNGRRNRWLMCVSVVLLREFMCLSTCCCFCVDQPWST